MCAFSMCVSEFFETFGIEKWRHLELAIIRVGLSNYTDIDKLLTLEEGDRTTVTFSSYESKATVNSAKTFRLTSTLENNHRAGKAGSETDELHEAVQSLGEVTDAFGAMFDAASKTIDAANKLNK